MRNALKELVKNTIILEYELPHKEKGLEKHPYLPIKINAIMLLVMIA